MHISKNNCITNKLQKSETFFKTASDLLYHAIQQNVKTIAICRLYTPYSSQHLQVQKADYIQNK